MAKFNSFTFISLNGFYKGLDENISWQRGSLIFWGKFRIKQHIVIWQGDLRNDGTFWPIQMVYDAYPEVAEISWLN